MRIILVFLIALFSSISCMTTLSFEPQSQPRVEKLIQQEYLLGNEQNNIITLTNYSPIWFGINKNIANTGKSKMFMFDASNDNFPTVNYYGEERSNWDYVLPAALLGAGIGAATAFLVGGDVGEYAIGGAIVGVLSVFVLE